MAETYMLRRIGGNPSVPQEMVPEELAPWASCILITLGAPRSSKAPQVLKDTISFFCVATFFQSLAGVLGACIKQLKTSCPIHRQKNGDIWTKYCLFKRKAFKVGVEINKYLIWKLCQSICFKKRNNLTLPFVQ